MEDFTALAESLSGSVGDARGALILSRDGLVLGAHPADAESQLKPAWLRFAALGEPERGFLQFGTEIWSYLRRGAYAAFVVTGTGVRPGLVIDQIEMVLLAAEESRADREGLRAEPAAPVPTAAPSGGLRTPLHPETRPSDQPVVIAADSAAQAVQEASTAMAPPEIPTAEPTPSRRVADVWATGTRASSDAPAPTGDVKKPAQEQPRSSVWGEGTGKAGEGGAQGDEENEDVDRASLAREFSQLLQEDTRSADG